MSRRYYHLAFVAVLAVPSIAGAQNPCTRASTSELSMPVTMALPAPLAIPSGSAFVGVCANGQWWDMTQWIVSDGPLAYLPTTQVDLGGGASFIVSAAFDADPFSAFTFGSVLPGGFGPIAFDVFFSTPVVPGSYGSASSSGTLGITVAGVTGVTTGTVSAGTYPAYISGLGDATNLGVDTGSGVCTVSTPPTPNSVSCNPPGAANTFASISPAFLTAHLSYTHGTTGPGTSTVGWTGAVNLDLSTVPEPATTSLVLGGLLLMGAATFTRRQRPS